MAPRLIDPPVPPTLRQMEQTHNYREGSVSVTLPRKGRSDAPGKELECGCLL